jgi:diacylglycerol kinase family enzyme
MVTLDADLLSSLPLWNPFFTMKKLRTAFLISTAAGSGQGQLAQSELPQILRHLGLSSDQYQVYQMAKHDPVTQAAEVSQNAGRLIAMGIIPFGTGNDLARVMNTHKILRREGLKACLTACLRGDAVPIDIWWVNGNHLMVNYLSIGVDAAVVNLFDRHRPQGIIFSRLPFISRCTYALFGIPHVFTRIKGETVVHLQCNTERQTHSLSGFRGLVISNIPQYAGGTLLAPDADYSDHRLDITPFLGILGFVGLFLFQFAPRWQHWYGRKLAHYRGEKIELHISPGNYLQIDGEDKTYLLQETHTLAIEHAGQALVIKGEP